MKTGDEKKKRLGRPAHIVITVIATFLAVAYDGNGYLWAPVAVMFAIAAVFRSVEIPLHAHAVAKNHNHCQEKKRRRKIRAYVCSSILFITSIYLGPGAFIDNSGDWRRDFVVLSHALNFLDYQRDFARASLAETGEVRFDTRVQPREGLQNYRYSPILEISYRDDGKTFVLHTLATRRTPPWIYSGWMPQNAIRVDNTGTMRSKEVFDSSQRCAATEGRVRLEREMPTSVEDLEGETAEYPDFEDLSTKIMKSTFFVIVEQN